MFMSIIAKSFLIFSDAIIISPLLIIGFLTRGGFFMGQPSNEGEVIWGRASLLVLFTMILSVFLKSLFLVPLNPVLGIKGYAFPSGHMLVAFVFYGWLAVAYGNWIWRGIIFLILAGIGFGLIQQGYHTIEDVLGACMFGIVTLSLFTRANSIGHFQKKPIHISPYLGLFGALMLVVVAIRIGLKANVVLGYLGLVAFSLAWFIFHYTIWKQKTNFS
jgi:membrane-associated phospholipid phosphatase